MPEPPPRCILCGCDYCDRPAGIGPKTALKLVRQYGNLETIVRRIDTKKHPLPAGELSSDII